MLGQLPSLPRVLDISGKTPRLSRVEKPIACSCFTCSVVRCWKATQRARLVIRETAHELASNTVGTLRKQKTASLSEKSRPKRNIAGTRPSPASI